jgi:hypothetical protein
LINYIVIFSGRVESIEKHLNAIEQDFIREVLEKAGLQPIQGENIAGNQQIFAETPNGEAWVLRFGFQSKHPLQIQCLN